MDSGEGLVEEVVEAEAVAEGAGSEADQVVVGVAAVAVAVGDGSGADLAVAAEVGAAVVTLRAVTLSNNGAAALAGQTLGPNNQ